MRDGVSTSEMQTHITHACTHITHSHTCMHAYTHNTHVSTVLTLMCICVLRPADQVFAFWLKHVPHLGAAIIRKGDKNGAILTHTYPGWGRGQGVWRNSDVFSFLISSLPTHSPIPPFPTLPSHPSPFLHPTLPHPPSLTTPPSTN